MKLKLICIDQQKITEYFFNDTDSASIIAECVSAGKQWSDKLVGFLINTATADPYAAIIVRADHHLVECMEYRDIDTNKAEFAIDTNLLSFLSGTEPHHEIPLNAFRAILDNVTSAPGKARRWEVYPEINKRYALTH